MKFIQFSMLFLAICCSIVQVSAQIKANQLDVKFNKSSKQLEVLKKSDAANITSSFQLEIAHIDIFDAAGEYAGSLELKNWELPVDEFSPEEVLKIANICIKNKDNGEILELKDIPLER